MMFLKKSLEFENNLTQSEKHLYRWFKQVTKNMLKIFLFIFFVDCKSWLNWRMDDHHLGYSVQI
jgi:hypothetical protein